MRFVAILLAVAACYDLPKPDCGFVCGPAGECPGDYTCNAADNRCHLAGTAATCPSGFDASPPPPTDRTAPQVVSFSPLQGAVDVLPSAKIVVMFSERVVGASPATIHLELSGAMVATDVDFDLATNTATVTPLMPLLRSSDYTVNVTDDLIDLAGNPLVGPTIWTFTTSTPPFVTARSPETAGVPVDSLVVADFNEMIFGITSVSFSVRVAGVPIGGQLAVTNGNTRVTFTPTNQLAGDTLHTVVLSPAITDAVGNSLVGAPVSWSFMTGPDAIAPVLVSQFPDPDRSDVAVTSNVVVSFDEPVTIPAGAFTLAPQGGPPVAAAIVISSGGRTASLRPDVDLAADTLHVVTLTAAITDGAGNPLAPTTFSFRTTAVP